MGYQEKRVWILLVTQVVAYGAYFWTLHHRRLHISDTLFVILAVIVLQIVLQILLAVTSNPERRDERDRAIEGVGYRAAYFALVCAVVFAVVFFVHVIGVRGPLSTMSVINTLFFALALGEISKLATEVVLYRRTA